VIDAVADPADRAFRLDAARAGRVLRGLFSATTDFLASEP
jgi:hypothetical protein